jgi:hypothetical protein
MSAFQVQAAHRIGTTLAAPRECGRQAERDGDDRSPSILLVAVLMKTEFGADTDTFGQVVPHPRRVAAPLRLEVGAMRAFQA